MFGGLFGMFQRSSQQVVGSAIRFSLGGPQAQVIRGIAKLKTHKGTAKRWRALANGKFTRRQVGLRHLNRRLSPNARRAKHRSIICTKGQQRHLERLLPK